jgi:hypothetical protein
MSVFFAPIYESPAPMADRALGGKGRFFRLFGL